jgi:hypothetical protein
LKVVEKSDIDVVIENADLWPAICRPPSLT